MTSWQRRALLLLFAATGFSALALQVVWQRVISIHGGVDLASTATVVSAFMAGLGAGNLLGGWAADRLGPRRSLLAFAGSNAGIGVFGLFSVTLFYDGYRALAGGIHGTLGAFAFHFGLLVIPTTLMGVSLPLLSRGVVRSEVGAASAVGRLYAVNTLGAAAGAAICGWWMLGNLGFDGTTRVASSINLVASAAVFLLWRAAADGAPPATAAAGQPPAPAPLGREWRWFALYGLTGAAALGLEIVCFRVVDAIMRSNSYTFAHVLTLYLLLFGGGTAFGARWARTAEDPGRRFLWIQFWIGATSLAGLLFLVNIPAAFGMRKLLEGYFATDGYLFGPEMPSGGRSAVRLAFAHLTGPLLVMGAPVFLMGAAYPHVMAVVSRSLETLGRRTGLLMTCNVAGNVLGSLVTGFLLLDVLGTSGTLRLLGAGLMILGLGAMRSAGPGRRAVPAGLGATAAAVALVLAFPANDRLWGFLHSAGPDRFALVEERSCVNALVRHGQEEVLYLNATSQNGYPYDDFHVLIGLAPALLHPGPARGMSVGLGIGSTAYGMLQDRRLQRVDSVEICGGERALLEILAARGARESRQLLEDRRHHLRVGDGRKHLLLAPEPYDVIVVDALRPNSGYSGNVYSVEFYELVASRLGKRGLFAQWIPTGRVLPSAGRAFPHVASVTVPGANGSFLLASGDPIELDRAAVLGRLGALAGTGAFSEAQHASLTRFFETVELEHYRRGEPRPELAGASVNEDLHPRDEYFLNDG